MVSKNIGSRNAKKIIVDTVLKNIPKEDFGILLSGGLDSAIIGKILKENGFSFNSYFSCVKGFSEPKDLFFSEMVAKELNSPLKKNMVSVKEFEKELPKIVSITNSSNPVIVGVASTIFFATKKVKEKKVFSGFGADEIFAGYSSFKKSKDIKKESKIQLEKMFEDLPLIKKIAEQNNTSLIMPFTDKKLIDFSFLLSKKQKILKNKDGTIINKKILRDVAGIELGLPEKIALRPKKAAQYGSNFDKALSFLAKKNGFESKRAYLESFQKESIGALVSTGKDSLFALYLMKKKGFPIKCLITIDSSNKDSFMFHTPTIQLAKLQSEALGIPLIIVKTKGEKEKELIDLKKSIRKAVKDFQIKGVCSGALFSNYQRERIQKICGSLKLKSFTPLWKKKQSDYVRFLIREGFEVMVTKIACFGLDENWLGKILSEKDVSELENLEKKFGINVAGEGGEYETLVLNAPFFEKKIFVEFEKKMENDFTGEIIIKKAFLEEK